MMNVHIALMILALICLFLAAVGMFLAGVGIPAPRLALGWLGLFFWALNNLIAGWPR